MIKINLSYAYKILSHLNLDDHTYTHLSARSEETSCFYIYPFGMCFTEVEPEILMKVSLGGNVISGSECQYNKTGYLLHSAIYKERRDVNAVFHIHTPEIVAVSASSRGLLPLSQWALHFYNKISYHSYDSLLLHENQSSKLVNDLGENFTMLLRNHGAVICGRSIEEALFFTYHLDKACKTQCLLQSMNVEYVLPSDAVCQKSVKDLLSFEENLGERDFKAFIRLIDRVQKK